MLVGELELEKKNQGECSRKGRLSLLTVDISGFHFVMWDCLVTRRMLTSSSDLHPPDATPTSLPRCDNQKLSLGTANVLLRQDGPRLRMTRIRLEGL